MRLEVKGENYNRLMKRRELDLLIDHTEEPTPATDAVQQLLAKQIDVPADKTDIREIMTSKGLSMSSCRVFIWDEKTISKAVKEEKSE